MNRKKFLRLLSSSALFLGASGGMTKKALAQQEEILHGTQGTSQGTLFDFSVDPIACPNVVFVGMGNRGQVLLQMMEVMIKSNKARVLGLCDLSEQKVIKSLAYLQTLGSEPAKGYHGDPSKWEDMIKDLQPDLVVICTPWEDHANMSCKAMELGSHVACEVPIAYTLEDCWKIIETAERTKKHCIMLENCCYNEEELWILNMVHQGVFGELNHAEGAYIHDLRALLLDETYYENQWRLQHHLKRDGNFYTTHGLGPISEYLGIGRGDNFDYLVSMSSREIALSQAAERINKPMEVRCGDMNSTLIKTKEGKSILLQFDVHTGRPYSRINLLSGSRAVHQGYPSRLYIDDPELKAWGHRWLDQDQYQQYRERYKHPLWSSLHEEIAMHKMGHGGMDFVMMYRLIECLNKGLPLDINVYDGVMWSAITPLSELSVAAGSEKILIPDFTGGQWKTKRQNEFMRIQL
jgi:hypothetical protein